MDIPSVCPLLCPRTERMEWLFSKDKPVSGKGPPHAAGVQAVRPTTSQQTGEPSFARIAKGFEGFGSSTASMAKTSFDTLAKPKAATASPPAQGHDAESTHAPPQSKIAEVKPHSIKFEQAMQHFIEAFQTGTEVSMAEVRSSGRQLGAILKDIRDVSGTKIGGGSSSAGADSGAVTRWEQTREALKSFKLRLEGSPLTTATIRAAVDERVIGRPEEEEYIRLEWYRATTGGAFTAIKSGGVYKASVDDVGARICVRACLLLRQGPSSSTGLQGDAEVEAPSISAFGEVGPLALDPETEAEMNACLYERKDVVWRGMKEPHGNVYDLEIDRTGLFLRESTLQHDEQSSPKSHTGKSAMEGDESVPRGGDGKPNQDGVVVGGGLYSKKVLIAIHPASDTVVGVQLPDLRGTEGELLVKTLICESRRDRDVLALVVRTFRRLTLPEEEEAGAVVDDMELEVSIAGIDPSPPSLLTTPVDTSIHTHLNAPATVGASKPVTCSTRIKGEGKITAEKPRAWSDSLLSVDSRLQQLTGLTPALRDERQAHNDAMRAAVDMDWKKLGFEGTERQIAKLSHQLALLNGEADRERTLRHAAESTAQAAATERNQLRNEVVAIQSKLYTTDRALTKVIAENQLSKIMAEEAKTRAAAAEKELEKVVMREQANASKASTNEAALTVMRQEVEALTRKVTDLQAEKERERSYFVSQLEERGHRLEKADARIIDFEQDLSNAHKQVEATEMQIEVLEEEAASLRIELQRHRSLEADLAEVTSRCYSAEARAAETEAKLKATQGKLAEAERHVDGDKTMMAGLIAERNALKNKADSLSREMARVNKLGRSVDDLEAMLVKVDDLQAETAAYRAENQRLQRQLYGDVKGHHGHTSSNGGGGGGPRKGSLNVGGRSGLFRGEDGRQAADEVAELHRQLQELKGTVQDKDMLLTTQREINRSLILRVQELESLVRGAGVKAVFDESDDEVDDHISLSSSEAVDDASREAVDAQRRK